MTALERPTLRPLADELARRLADGQVPATITIPDACRSAVADLLGLDRVPASGRRLGVARLLEALGLPDVDALRHAVESVTGHPVPRIVAPRRPGDPPESVADPARAQAVLGWTARRSGLREIVADAWAAMRRAYGEEAAG